MASPLRSPRSISTDQLHKLLFPQCSMHSRAGAGCQSWCKSRRSLPSAIFAFSVLSSGIRLVSHSGFNFVEAVCLFVDNRRAQMLQRTVIFSVLRALKRVQGMSAVSQRPWATAVSLGKVQERTEKRMAIARFMDGSDFFNLALKIGNRERVLNRNKAEPVLQTLNRLRLATVASAMADGMEKHGSAVKRDKLSPVVTLYDKSGEKLSEKMTNEEAWRIAGSLSIGDSTYSVLVNPPCVLALILPDLGLVGFPLQPTAHLEFCKLSDCRVRWFIKRQSAGAEAEDLEEVGSGPTYTPRPEDENALLSVEVMPIGENGVEGVPLRIAPLTRITAPPSKMLFQDRHKHTPSYHGAASRHLRIVTYNTLSEIYCSTSTAKDFLFSYCAPQALEFGYRSQMLMAEMRGYHADLLCMQEVDKRHFKNFFSPQFVANGYEGVFLSKRRVLEGCALFWRSERFALRQQYEFCLQDELDKQSWWKKVASVKNVEVTLRTRTTVLQCVELESDGQRLLVANTHLYYHAEARHIRLLQSAVIAQILERLQTELSAKCNSPVPVILCGDFNSHTDTGAFEFFSTGWVSKDHPDWVLNADGSARFDLKHSLEFDSVAPAECMPFTNFVQTFEGVLDHIFFDRRKFALHSLVPVPSREEVTRYTALPSMVCPSDHLAVVADLEWKQ